MKLVYREPKSIGREASQWDLELMQRFTQRRGGGGDQAGRFGGATEKGMKRSVREPLTTSAGAEANCP